MVLLGSSIHIELPKTSHTILLQSSARQVFPTCTNILPPQATVYLHEKSVFELIIHLPKAQASLYSRTSRNYIALLRDATRLPIAQAIRATLLRGCRISNCTFNNLALTYSGTGIVSLTDSHLVLEASTGLICFYRPSIRAVSAPRPTPSVTCS